MRNSQISAPTETDDLLIGAILSFVFPGVGHLVVGREGRGLQWIVATVLFYSVSFVLVFFPAGFLLLFLAPLLHTAAAAGVMFGY